MALRIRSASPATESSLTDPWSGLWGSVVADKKSMAMLRLELPTEHGTQAIHGLTYGSLSRWLWHKNDELEMLELRFGTTVVKIAGKGLDTLTDAVDEGRLKLLRVCPKEAFHSALWIKSIKVDLADKETLSQSPFSNVPASENLPEYDQAIRRQAEEDGKTDLSYN